MPVGKDLAGGQAVVYRVKAVDHWPQSKRTIEVTLFEINVTKETKEFWFVEDSVKTDYIRRWEKGLNLLHKTPEAARRTFYNDAVADVECVRKKLSEQENILIQIKTMLTNNGELS